MLVFRAPSPFALLRAHAMRWVAILLLCTSTVGCASVPDNVPRTPSHALETPEDTALGKLVVARRGSARSDSGFMLLSSVDLAFGGRVALIDAAQRTLDLQYYAIHADSSTEILLEHLRAAAQRGVRVRILLDDFNTAGEDAQVLRLAFVKGVEMRLFNPLPGSRGSLVGKILGSLHQADHIQKRMHNKLFIADNAWGIAGGRNLGDAYFGGDGESAFVDLDVLAAGAVVKQMSSSFDRYWNNDLAYPVHTLLDKRDLDRLEKKEPSKEHGEATPPAKPGMKKVTAQQQQQPQAAAPSPSQPTVRTQPGPTVLPNASPTPSPAQGRPLDLQQAPLTWAPAALLADKPGKVAPGDDEVQAGETVVDGLLQLVSQARQEVLIISPYFVPGAEMMRLFAELRGRGVAVRVLTNSLASNDAPAAHAGYKRYREDLLKLGVELHEMRSDPATAGLQTYAPPAGKDDRGAARLGSGSGPGGSKSGTSRASLHSKAVIIDRRLAVIGSMNLDLRSQQKNSEVALLIRSPALAGQAAKLIENAFAHSSYRVELRDGHLHWLAPQGASFPDATSEPEADWKLKLLVDVLAPIAPEQML
ncbi:phospholipase D family protein [Ramlibacter sp. MMS24-I3-19]|uniref:phospholipase D family protein n=1 Tax=Ramlibacter sp. MMS24-I3-19 TaxID=3416606 RepID=UPI003CFDA9D6